MFGLRTLENRAEKYNYVSFSPGIIADYNVKVSAPASFVNIARVGYIEITTTSDITIKINSTDAPSIPLTSTKTFVLDVLAIENIYITNVSATPVVTIFSTF